MLEEGREKEPICTGRNVTYPAVLGNVASPSRPVAIGSAVGLVAD